MSKKMRYFPKRGSQKNHMLWALSFTKLYDLKLVKNILAKADQKLTESGSRFLWKKSPHVCVTFRAFILFCIQLYFNF